MQHVDIVAVVGACAPERARYAKRMAAVTGRALVPATRLAVSPDPVDEAATIAPWITAPAGAVIELPHSASVIDAIGALTDRPEWSQLSAVVCVVDALHLMDELQRDSYAERRTLTWDRPEVVDHVAHALLTVTQLEYASMIVLVNWAALSTAELSALMALVNHLSPRAALRLHRGGVEASTPGIAYTATQDRPGWVGLLNDEFAPHITDPDVAAFRYENVRPLHPGRLARMLDDQLEPGAFGTVIRSAGFCRLATRAHTVAQWEHVGSMISFEPLGRDDGLGDDDELLAIGQDIAFIGIDLDPVALTTALDQACLSDEELAAGPARWTGFVDPFPRWMAAGHPGAG